MSKINIDLLIQQVAPDADTAWSWLRQMHESGYQLTTCGSGLPAFSMPNTNEWIMPVIQRGAVAWIAVGLGAHPSSDPSFPDPIAAWVWWQTQESNRQVADASWDDGTVRAAPCIPPAPPSSQMIQPVPQMPQNPWVVPQPQQPTAPPPSAPQGKPAKPRKTLAELQYEEQLKRLGQP